MSRYAAAFRDIFLIYIFCLLLTFWAGIGKIGESADADADFLDFDGPLPFPNTFTPERPAKPEGVEVVSETFIDRVFDWEDYAKQQRKTVFHIPQSALNSEIKKFGRPRAMTNPLFLEQRGFKIIERRSFLHGGEIQERVITIVDYKRIFERNLQYFSPLTESLTVSAEIPVGMDPVPALLSFVQAIPYKKPPHYYNNKFIGSFFVPLVLLYEQYADCDSKSLLLAEFLGTTPDSKEKMGMVLVRGKGLSHAVLGVKRKHLLLGKTYLYFAEKGYFIVMETTRQGWSPGFLDPRVLDVIKAGYFQFIELN